MQSLIEISKNTAREYLQSEVESLRNRLEFLGQMDKVIAETNGAEIFELLKKLTETAADVSSRVEAEVKAPRAAAKEPDVVKTERKRQAPAPKTGAPSRDDIIEAITTHLRKGPQTQPVVQTYLAGVFKVAADQAWNARVYNILCKEFEVTGEGRGKTYSVRGQATPADNNPFA